MRNVSSERTGNGSRRQKVPIGRRAHLYGFLRRKCRREANMAVTASLIGSAKCFRKLQYIFAGAGKNSSCAFGAVTSWRRQCSSHSEQVSNESHMFDSMDNPYKEPPKRCVLCHVHVDYKNVQLLSQFISPYTGRILGKHITGLCPKKQKEISRAIKRAHHLGFMSVTYKDPTFRGDPKICNVRYPD